MKTIKTTRSDKKFQLEKDKIRATPNLIEQCLSATSLKKILFEHDIQFRDRIFSPMTTLWVFMSQVLEGNCSCRKAVAHFMTTLKKKSCSLATGAYCQARQRLKEGMLRALCLAQGEEVRNLIQPAWLWRRRDVFLIDGTTVSMPDSADNQHHFPATNRQRNPLEFPVVRIVVILCRTTGALLNAAIGPYQGKESGETSLLKTMLPSFKPGDVSVFDRYYAGFFCFCNLMKIGVDCVCRQHHLRIVRRVKKLGKNDFLFLVKRPDRPPAMSIEEYQSYPKEILLRCVQVRVKQKGFRTRKLDVITSLIDKKYLADEIAELYKSRWFVEVDIRSLKSDMGMDVLSCKTADMVRKEIWVYFLAYNLVRMVIMDAAKKHSRKPRSISFKAAMQMLVSFRSKMTETSSKKWSEFYNIILGSLKTQTIGRRPDRFEPRAKKRRPPPNLKYLKESRQEARKKCGKCAS
jgi:hypothetical protein